MMRQYRAVFDELSMGINMSSFVYNIGVFTENQDVGLTDFLDFFLTK